MCHSQRGDESWPLWLLGSFRFAAPTPAPHPFQEKGSSRAPWMPQKRKENVCFPLYLENVSQHLFLLGIRQTRLFHHHSSPQTAKASGTQTCGISYQKCDLVSEPKLQTSYLSDQGKAFLLEALNVSHCPPRPWMSPIAPHFSVHKDWDTDRGQKRPR